MAKLQATGLKLVQWYGTCEADRVNSGNYDVPPGEGGMYALLFDNTFSKQHSKKATFVLLTYPTKSPPRHDHYIQHNRHPGVATSAVLKDSLNEKKGTASQSSADLTLQPSASPGQKNPVEEKGVHGQGRVGHDQDLNFFSGTLQKRRRRRHQGWARRYFSLDYSTSTLTYYHDRSTASLRGAIPLSLAAVGANATTREISIDSGVEVWHLKAPSQKDFRAWKQALETAHAPTYSTSPDVITRRSSLKPRLSIPLVDKDDQREWAGVDELLVRIRASRDAARTIAKDTDPKYLPMQSSQPLDTISGYSSASESPSEPGSNGYFVERSRDRRPFWKRKASGDRPMPGAFKRSISATPSIPTSHSYTPPNFSNAPMKSSESMSHHSLPAVNVHEQCMTLLKDLDSIVADFDLLRDQCRQRREPFLNTTVSRLSLDSQDDEFFDVEGFSTSQLLDIQDESEDELSDRASVASSSSSTNDAIDRPESIIIPQKGREQSDPAFPEKARELTPLPVSHVHRRKQVKRPNVSPPSLIGLLRKNVGKDMSTISMPVSTNEPTSFLQRAAENLEYSYLLDSASTAKTSFDRLLFIAAFAISHLSSSRVRERTIRKPFNPMLGETFELVREDRGFRFLAEKVSHHPVQLAYQAQSSTWSFTQSPMPSQKFWGKSCELLTEGKLRIVLHDTGDHFSWIPPTSFLRNIIAGEKYVEPVGSMVVLNETTGEKAIVAFKSGGMFSGRSEEVIAHICDKEGSQTDLGLMGKWTLSLAVTDRDTVRQSGNPIWTVGDLAVDATKQYGFTSFAATLNEITPLEIGSMAPTDSRLRPDQRAAEDGDLDQAETLKGRLEEAQRERRRDMQAKGVEWHPRWFEKVQAADGDTAWVLKVGTEGYWSNRQRGSWNDVERVFENP